MGCASSARASSHKWVVEVTKDETTMLGIGTKKTKDGLAIVSIFEEGALAKWNANNPDHDVLVGDTIVSVNGNAENPWSMLDQMWQKGTFQLEILRGRKPGAKRNQAAQVLEQDSQVSNEATGQTKPVSIAFLKHVCARDSRETMCAVCHDEYADPDVRLVELPCKHSFHASCVAEWFETGSRRCPLCNHSLGSHTVFGNFEACCGKSTDPSQVDHLIMPDASPESLAVAECR